MLISGGTLVSDCHGAIVYYEGEEYRCMQCLKPCKSAGTKEHARLQSAVVQAARAWYSANENGQENANLALGSAIYDLDTFEQEHGIGIEQGQ